MTEPKKVAFSTLGPIKKEKKKEKKMKTVRIILTLPESNEKSCPEFNYRELVSLKLVSAKVKIVVRKGLWGRQFRCQIRRLIAPRASRSSFAGPGRRDGRGTRPAEGSRWTFCRARTG